MLHELLLMGVDVVRLNFSHGEHASHKQSIEWIRKASQDLKHDVAILADLQGPKIRTSKLAQMMVLSRGQSVFFSGTSDRLLEGDGTAAKPIGITYPRLASELKKGDILLIEDGLTRMDVVGTDKAKNLVEAKVVFGESLNSHKGVNIPGAKLSASSITEKDWDDILFGIENEVDFFALSFVRSSQEVKNLKTFLKTKGAEIQVIAKIEMPEALENIDDIINVSDGIMIARGDLGVEIGNERVPLEQKRLIKKARATGKPVITATQMLMSMVLQPTPTRAEASDVANAVFDGSDALMLSNETATGAYPLKVIETMERIIMSAEQYQSGEEIPPDVELAAPLEAAAVLLSDKINSKALSCLTRSGLTARNLARLRPVGGIYAFVENEKVRRQLSLTRGVFVIPWQEVKSQDYTVFDDMAAELGRIGILKRGDMSVFIAGIPTSQRQGTSNTVALRKYGSI
jgi:pyruvate kinase